MKKERSGDVVRAVAFGLMAAVAAALLAYPGLHPSVWKPLAEAAGLRPPDYPFNGLWHGIASVVYAVCGAQHWLDVIRGLGFVAFGAMTAVFYLFANDVLLLGIKEYDRHFRRRLNVRRIAAFVGTVAFACAEPIWRGAQSFSPDFLRFFALLVALRCFTRYYYTESEKSLMFGMFVAGLFLAETAWAAVVILVGVGFFLLNEHGILTLSGTVSTKTRVNVAKWRISLVVVCGLLLMIAANVTLFVWRDGLAANALGPQRLIISSLRVYCTSFSSAASALGWTAALVLVILPSVLLLWAMRRAADEELLLPYGLGVCYFAGALLAISQLGALPSLWITSWGDQPLITDPLFLMILSGFSVTTLFIAISVFGVYAFCHGHVGKGMVTLVDLANSDDYDGEREASLLRHAVQRNYRKAKLLAALGLTVLVAAVSIDRICWTTKEELRAIEAYLDAVLEDCKGLKYLFTDGRFDDAIRLRADARGQVVHPFSFMAGQTSLELGLVTKHLDNDEDVLSAKQGAPSLLRTWMRDKKDRLDDAGVQIGFELWQRDLKGLPPCWGTLARTKGSAADEKASLERAQRLCERILSYYERPFLNFLQDRLVHDLFQTAQWRVSRLARMRADKYEIAGRVAESKANLEWAKKLDEKNDAVSAIFRALHEAQQANLRKIAPREALHLALVRADFASARFYAEQIFSSAPHNPEVNFAMAMSYVMQGHFSRAERHFRTCLNLSPKDPTLLNNLAMCLLAQNRLQEARKSAELALTRAPDSKEIRRTLDDIADAERAVSTNGIPKKVKAPRIGTQDIPALPD